MKFNIYIVIALLVCLTTQGTWAQDSGRQQGQEQEYIRCYSYEADQELREKYPEMGTIEEFEERLAPLVEAYKESVRNGERRDVTTIPIVFHIIHNGEAVGTGTNVNATYVQAQVDQLNNDFRKAPGTSGDNDDPVGADSEIQYCLALRGPDGTPLDEPGINRINRNDQGWVNPPFSTAYIQNNIKAATVWDSEDYLNVWSANITGGILGYAQFPNNTGLDGLSANNGSELTDGVVILYSSLGSTETPYPGGAPYNMGRTLTHEIGHYLGLRHIWGDANCGNDYCDDTPTQATSSGGNCPNSFTCGSSDMTTNYMDYSNDVCMDIFTEDQKARMQVVVTGVRSGLGDNAATVCDPDAAYAAFSASSLVGCQGSTILFVDNSGGSGLVSRLWDFGDGSSSSEERPTHTYASPGEYDVVLTVNDGSEDYSASRTVKIGASNAAGTYDHLNGGTLINELAMNEGGTSGYLGGHNSFEDNAKAEYFDEGAAGTTLGPVEITFAVADGPIISDARCVVWDEVGGQPGGVLAVVEVSLSSIATDGTPTIIDFGGPTLNGPFYVGIELDYSDNTDISIFTNENGDTDPVTAWERWSDNTWHSFNDGTEFTWQWDVALAIEAEILCNVSQAPVAPVSAFSVDAASVCLGDEISFTDESTNEPDEWFWDFGDGNVSNASSPDHTYASAGTYTVSLTTENFAGEDEETKTDFVTVNELPEAPVISNAGGGALSATSGSSGTYQWYLNGDPVAGATGADYQAISDGEYQAILTDGNGCTAGSNELGVLTAVIDDLLDAAVSIYPNPVANVLTVEFSNYQYSGLTMTLVDVAGRELHAIAVDQPVMEINMQTFSAGVYLLKLENSEGGTTVRKIVKQQ